MPKTKTPGKAPGKKTDVRVRKAALALIRQDHELDDAKFTPPGAIGHYIDGKRAPRRNTAE